MSVAILQLFLLYVFYCIDCSGNLFQTKLIHATLPVDELRATWCIRGIKCWRKGFILLADTRLFFRVSVHWDENQSQSALELAILQWAQKQS